MKTVRNFYCTKKSAGRCDIISYYFRPVRTLVLDAASSENTSGFEQAQTASAFFAHYKIRIVRVVCKRKKEYPACAAGRR